MGTSSYDFVWGSNGIAANQGMALLCAYQLTGDSSYFKAALANLDYLFGRNGTTYCFMTGFGSHSPMHIHHRPSQSDGIVPPVPGLLAGGPNPGRQDGVTTYPSTMPALCYTDDVNSYASNEICINWNAPLVFLAIGIEAIASPNGLPTGIRRDGGSKQVPKKHGLLQNYPNPFNPTTTIEYFLPHQGYVGLRVYNLLGQSVCSLLNGWMSAGEHRVSFSGSDLSSGTYICRLTANGLSLTKKMVLMK
jgi:endoglucanase